MENSKEFTKKYLKNLSEINKNIKDMTKIIESITTEEFIRMTPAERKLINNIKTTIFEYNRR